VERDFAREKLPGRLALVLGARKLPGCLIGRRRGEVSMLRRVPTIGAGARERVLLS